MKYLTYCGNSLINARLPDGAEVVFGPEPLAGISQPDVPEAVAGAFRHPLGMPPLHELVGSSSRILIAFDDNCQPFPATPRPDIRQQALEVLFPLLYSCGVQKKNIRLVCAIALHRKMKEHELARMVGPAVMREFYPWQLTNWDAEDPDDVADLGATEQGEPVRVCQGVVDSDLVIYIDSVQLPLNGGHKSVAVGLGTYESIASHHHPKMTADSPHVMQPQGSAMHESIERLSRVILRHSRIMVMEAAMNNATYPPLFRFVGRSPARCNVLEKMLRWATPATMAVTPEPIRRRILRSVRGAYAPIEINAGAIEPVHARTLAVMKAQMTVTATRQYDTMLVGLPDLSPYAVGARINPVLVLSDSLGYIFNWFYNRPLVKPGGVFIILNPTYEVFHEEYHVPYRKFYEEVLAASTDPFKIQELFQEKYARDPHLIDCYRHRYAHHGFHPFTVWYWATYGLKYLSRIILVGPEDDRSAKRLGVCWAPSLDHALGLAREITGGDDVVALTMPPFYYFDVR